METEERNFFIDRERVLHRHILKHRDSSLLSVDSASCMYTCVAAYSAATMNRIARMSSSLGSIRSFADPQKGDPNSGMIVLLFLCFLDFLAGPN